ncbi:MAG: hypothetical protein IKT56_05555 [Clostridia bacterium]|nr:hypothetical protein [Clostridia bacterium]
MIVVNDVPIARHETKYFFPCQNRRSPIGDLLFFTITAETFRGNMAPLLLFEIRLYKYNLYEET